MATTTIFLRLTDGTTTCDFSTGSTTFSIRAPGWEPAIAAPRESALGGLGAYSDVDEVIPLYVLGSTAALAQAQLRALVRLLDQAKAFDDGENSTPVRLEAQVQGSDLAAPLQVRIRGGRVTRVGTEYAEGTLYAPVGIPIDLTVTRRGEWLEATEETSSNDASFTSTDTAGLTFATNLTSTIHPTRIEISGLTNNADMDWYPGYVVVAPSSNHIQLSEAESISYSGASTADAPRMARGGNYELFTTTSTGGSVALNAQIIASRMLHSFASVSIGSGTWSTWRRLYYGATSYDVPAFPIAPAVNALDDTDPFIVAYPPVPPGSGLTNVELVFYGSGSLAVDWVCHAGDAQVIDLGNPDGYVTTGTRVLHVDHQALTGRRPRVAVVSNSGASVKLVPYAGDAYLLTSGTTLGIAWLQTERNSIAGSGFWTISSSGSGSSAQTHTITAFRRKAFVVPE